MSKQTKRQLDNIELIDLPNVALFEVKLVIAMDDFIEDDPCTAADWLFNLLHIVAEHDGPAKVGASELLAATLATAERRVHLCTVETVEA